MFFISPPPSPPFGWEVRPEGPPNKEVHADDLAQALTRLRQKHSAMDDSSPIDTISDSEGVMDKEGRQRSGSTTMVYQPDPHGASPGLPAVMVEDTTGSGDVSPTAGVPILAHTARPPVELMQDM